MSTIRTVARLTRFFVILGLVVTGTPAAAGWVQTYVTGGTPGGEVIFRVTLDPTLAGSAMVSVAVADPTRRLDGIDFLPGSKSLVSVGAQFPMAGGGAIAQFDVSPGAAIPVLPDFVAATGAGTKPSTVLNFGGYVYYIENQFGFGGGMHRIMRTPVGGPAGTTEVVFAPGAGIVNLEGLEIHGGLLYFFGADPAMAGTRALYSVGLDGAGLSVGAATKLKGGLTGSPDGADEVDRDPLTGYIFGTNMVTGEVIYWDPGTMMSGTLVPEAAILAHAGDDIGRFKTAKLDGIRSTGDGYLVLTGLDGVILSIDILGALAGLDVGDVKILFDGKGFSAAPGLSFDDLTPLFVVPLPGSLPLLAMGLTALAFAARRRSRSR